MMLNFDKKPFARIAGAVFEFEEGYQICSKTVMDTTTGTISFDSDGVSNFVKEFNDCAEKTIRRPDFEKKVELEAIINEIKLKSKGKDYDCILGLSGGVDSSYLAHLCKEFGLNPLCVHFDYGWNTEQAVNNIQQIIKKTGFDLHTFVIDWESFRDLQKAYFEAGVLDLDTPADHLIFGALYRVASEKKIYTILNGTNIANEFVLPSDWYFRKADFVNLKSINRKFGSRSFKNIPTLSRERRYYYESRFNLFQVSLLNLVDYSKNMAIKILKEEYGWQYYGGKHFETVFTRWYQGCYLPLVYGIDKRKAHLSNLILNGEISRDEALKELTENPTYDRLLQMEDCEYVAKKWGYSLDEFFKIFYEQKKHKHEDFGLESDFNSRLLCLLRKIPIKLFSYFAK